MFKNIRRYFWYRRYFISVKTDFWKFPLTIMEKSVTINQLMTIFAKKQRGEEYESS